MSVHETPLCGLFSAAFWRYNYTIWHFAGRRRVAPGFGRQIRAVETGNGAGVIAV